MFKVIGSLFGGEPVVEVADKPIGDVFQFGITKSDAKTFGKSTEVTEDYINSIHVSSVQGMLTKIKSTINHTEKKRVCSIDSKKLGEKIFTVEDVVFAFVHVVTMRGGCIYIVLQISSRYHGFVRVSAFATDTNFHSNGMNMPNAEDVQRYLGEYLSDSTKLRGDVDRLRKKHSTTKTTEELIATIPK